MPLNTRKVNDLSLFGHQYIVLASQQCRIFVHENFALQGQIIIPTAINTEIPLTLSAMRFLAPGLLLNL